MNYEIPSRHVSKILWAREDNDSFVNRDFIQEVGECLSETERTVSSCSWGFDEYEIKSTKRINASLNAIEEALYEGIKDPLLNHELYDECQKWSQKFPHLRLKGNELVPINSNVTTLSSPTDDTVHHVEINIPFSSDDIEHACGVRPTSSMDSLPMDSVKDDDNNYKEHEIILEDDEDIIEDGDHITSFEPRNESRDDGFISIFDKSSSTQTPPFSIDYIANKVIEKLASKVWSEVLVKWGKTRENESYELKNNDYLPPIPASQEINCKSTFQRPWTRGKTPKSSDFPKLDGILTVSPKVLQKRPESAIRKGSSQRTRPNTGVSVMSYSSIGSFHNPIMSKQPVKSLEKTIPDEFAYRSTSVKSLDKDSDFLISCLPIVEENGPLLQSKLIGDLYIKDSFPKLKISDVPNFPTKPTFLPPIDDRDVNWNSPNQDLQRPISYESHLPGYKKHNQTSIYTRHLNKMSVRPSTTKTSWNMRNSNFDIKKHKVISPVENHSSLSQKKLTPEHVDNLVNFFPIVTSLEPRQLNDRNKNQKFNRKNNVLGAFPQKNKR